MKKDFNILFLVPSPVAYIEIDEWLLKKSIKRVPNRQCSLGVLELIAYLKKHVEGLNIQFYDMAKGLMEIKNNILIESIQIDLKMYTYSSKKINHSFLNAKITQT